MIAHILIHYTTGIKKIDDSSCNLFTLLNENKLYERYYLIKIYIFLVFGIGRRFKTETRFAFHHYLQQRNYTLPFVFLR